MKKLYLTVCMLAPLAAMASEAPAAAPATEPAETSADGTSEIMIAETPTKVKLMIASDAAAAAEPDNVVVIQPTGRILLDGAIYATNDDEFKAGVAIPDFRAGVKFRYGKWKAKVDVGYAYGKVGMKDVFMEYDFTPNFLIRMGSFIHQFGLQSATSSSMKVSMEEPTSNEAFNFSRMLGAMAVYDKGDFFGTLSLNVESGAMNYRANDMGKQGWGGLTRLVWRPLHDNGSVVQVGFSFAGQSAPYNADKELNHRSVTLGSNFPTRVNRVSAVGALVTDASNTIRFTPELLLNYGRVALETQYYFLQANRHNDLPAYKAWGAYGMIRGLAIGDTYKYSHADAGLATPSPKSLELVLLYNYTNMSCKDAGIFGGRMNDISLTANWYINKFMIWRVRAGYSHRFDRAGMPDVNLGAFQTRLQVIF